MFKHRGTCLLESCHLPAAWDTTSIHIILSVFLIGHNMLRQLYQSLALVAAVHATGIFANGVDIESLFGPYLSPGTEIAEPTDADFSTVASPRWSEWKPPTWTGAIKPKTERDLQKIVSWFWSRAVRDCTDMALPKGSNCRGAQPPLYGHQWRPWYQSYLWYCQRH